MILMVFLLAPTVPSEPRPHSLQQVQSEAVSSSGSLGNDRKVTSSSMPMVKLFLGSGAARFSYTARIWAGVVSLEARP